MMQTTSKTVDFFLGATTPAGFKGYFEPLRREPGMQMYLIKSGPGCGKSTLMKQLAAAAHKRQALLILALAGTLAHKQHFGRGYALPEHHVGAGGVQRATGAGEALGA